MSWLHRLFHRRADAELDEEIRFHLAQEVQLRIDRGESPQEAARAAQRAFGNTTLVKEVTRQMWGSIWVEDFLRDVRHALRGMRRAPTFTSIAVLSLALGIGANTAIFSLIDAVMLRLLPVERPEELVAFSIPSGRGSYGFSYPLFEALRDHNQTLSGMFAVSGATLSVTV